MHEPCKAFCQHLARNRRPIELKVRRCLIPRPVDKLSAVCKKTTNCKADVLAHCEKPPACPLNEHLRDDQLLKPHNHAILAPHTHCRAADFYCLRSVLHLEHSAIRRVARGVQVVPSAYAAHCDAVSTPC